MGRKKVLLDRRERIIQAADRLFNHYSYQKTTMEDISREADVPRATIYLEFPGGKEAILMTSIQQFLSNLLVEMRRLAEKRAANGWLHTLRQVLMLNVLALYDRSIKRQYEQEILLRLTDRVRLEMPEYFLAKREIWKGILQQAALQGELSLTDDANRLVSMLEYGLSTFLPPHGNRFTRDVLEQDTHDFLLLLLAGFARKQARIAPVGGYEA